MNRSNLFWGLLILLVGVLFLLEPLGILPEGTNVWGFFWPILLILLGLMFLIGPRLKKDVKLEQEALSIPLEGAVEARIRIRHGAGELHIQGTEDQNILLSGEFLGGIVSNLQRKADHAKLKISSPSHIGINFPFFDGFNGYNWDVNINQNIPVSLDIHTGASDSKIDLEKVNVKKINLESGASSTTINLPANAGFTKVTIESGAASVKMRLPENVGCKAEFSGGLASFDVDHNRFDKINGVYITRGYEQAENKIEISAEMGAGSVEIR